MTVIEQYNAGLTTDADRTLALAMHTILRAVLPDAEMKLAYGLVGYYQPKAVCYFGINKRHIGFYPTNQPLAHFAKALLSPPASLIFWIPENRENTTPSSFASA